MGRRSEKLAELHEASANGQPFTDVVQVVARAFDVMRCFDASHRSLANGDICQLTQLPPSTVSRLTQTLTAIGQLSYSPNERRYQLGSAALAMGSSWLRGLKSRSVIRSLMMELAEEVPGIIAMTVRDGFDMVLIECCRSETTVGVFSEVGSHRSVAHTASGRAYLLAQTAARRNAFLKELARKSPADARKLSGWLKKNEAAFNAQGITTASGEDHPQINGIAVPVWSEDQSDFFVLSIGVISTVYSTEALQREAGPKLLALRDKVKTWL